MTDRSGDLVAVLPGRGHLSDKKAVYSSGYEWIPGRGAAEKKFGGVEAEAKTGSGRGVRGTYDWTAE